MVLHQEDTFFKKKFGPDIKKKVDQHILQKNTKSCAIVNGQISTWFSIERDCRQGDPLSPYTFFFFFF